MKIRTLRELYTILLEELVNQTLREYPNGLCHVIICMNHYDMITDEECDKLLTHLEKQKPTKRNKYKEFTLSEVWQGTSYWWRYMSGNKESREARIHFLQEVIKNL